MHNTPSPSAQEAAAQYRRGRALMQRGQLGAAKSAFLQAVRLDAESPAAEALHVLEGILAFHHKDRYNP